jgi:hypothetical protein
MIVVTSPEFLTYYSSQQANNELLRHIQAIMDCASNKVVLMSNVLYPQTTTRVKKIHKRSVRSNDERNVEESEDVYVYETVLSDEALARRAHEQMCHDASYHRHIVVTWLNKAIQFINMILAANQDPATRDSRYHQISM